MTKDRCTLGLELLDTLGQAKFNATSAFSSVRNQAPLLNVSSTYVVMMIPDTGHFKAYHSYAACPVPHL